MTRRAGYLTPIEMFRLDLACKPIEQAFGEPPYLVGSVNERPDFRDVDVRLILADDVYDRMIQSVAMRALLSFAFTSYLREATGLSIDFGIQRMTEANALHKGKSRNPLGTRNLGCWPGDAPIAG